MWGFSALISIPYLADVSSTRFADDIDGLAGEEEELVNLVNRVDETSARYGMDISAEKNPKLMTNSSNAIRSCITAHGQELETVKQFKYLGAIINDEGSKTEILATSAQTSKLNQFGETKTSR